MDTFDGEIGLLQIGLDALSRMVGARYGAIHILNEQGESICFLHSGIRKEDAGRLASEAPPGGLGPLGNLAAGEVIRLEVLTKDQSYRGTGAPGLPRMKHLLGVPLAAEGRVYGHLYLAEKAGGPFTEEDERLALTVGFKAAMAVESHRLGRRFRNQLETLHRLSSEFAEERNSERLLQHVIDSATRLIDADHGVLTLFNEEGRITQFLTCGLTPEKREEIMSLPEVRGLLEAVWKEGKTLRLDKSTTSFPAFSVPSLHPLVRSLLATRICFREESFGSLCLTKTSGSFRVEDEQLLGALAANAASALQSARLFEAVAHESERWETLCRFDRLLSRPIPLEQAFPDVAAAIKTYVPFDRIDVVVPRGEQLFMAMSVAEPPMSSRKGQAWPRTGETAVEWVLTHGQSRVIRNLALEQLFADETSVVREGIRSSLMVPLQTNGEQEGVLVLGCRSPDAYKDRDLEWLAPLVERLAVAFQNARIMEELRQALENLKAAQEQLVRIQSLRALGELAGGTAHHLNNMLAIILGQIQLLRITVTDAAIQGSLETIERAASDGAETVRRLQAFARSRPAADLVPVDLVRIAEESLEFTRPRWQDEALTQGIHIELERELSQVPPISGQASELREVITNLILNAVDAMPHGGRMTAKTWSEPGWVCLLVSDTGVGMSNEVRRRAFEPFFGTKGLGRAGLGLSVAYGIVQHHGGEITIESAEGRGTTVTLRFPSATGRVATQSEEFLGSVPETGSEIRFSGATPPPVAPSLRLGKILVIDDEARVRSLLAEILSTQGHTVDQASDGSEGLALLEESRYDLVITDLGMPAMTGWEVARAVKARWPWSRVILVTGWGESVEREATAEQGVDALLCKPFMVQEVRSLVAKLLENGAT